MIKELIIFNIILYLILAFVWQMVFENKFIMKYKKNGEEEAQKVTGFLLTFVCLFWIVLLPFIIRNTRAKEEE